MPEEDKPSPIPDLPRGPLCEYRQRAKFSWKALKQVLEDPNVIRIKYDVWQKLEREPLFAPLTNTLPVDQQKERAAKQVKRIAELKLDPQEIYSMDYKYRVRYLMSINEALHAVCPSMSVKIALGVGLFTNALLAMGSERHSAIYNAAWNREIITCLAITEVSHGSNTKRCRTTATYDPKTQEFIINTPDFEAAKCWVGNLGKTGSMALLFAILHTSDGQNHGLQGFLVPIRDPTTLQPYPGVIVGDIGEKIGLNGIDNGFVMFNNYRIPRENMLNRAGDVTPEGTYESTFTEPGKILGAVLESFSAGRLGIMQESSNTLSHATVIAVRYAALRKQFGPEKDGPEQSVMEYQLHQWRIFPYLAAACVLKASVFSLTDIYLATVQKSQKDSNGFELLSQIVSELHALVSSSKPLVTWTARDAIQESREACGGHGYLRAANLGELRNNHDPSCTYEGDNNVLGQQASNWLLRQWKAAKVESPVGTANFIERREAILGSSFDAIVRASGGAVESAESPEICSGCRDTLHRRPCSHHVTEGMERREINKHAPSVEPSLEKQAIYNSQRTTKGTPYRNSRQQTWYPTIYGKRHMTLKWPDDEHHPHLLQSFLIDAVDGKAIQNTPNAVLDLMWLELELDTQVVEVEFPMFLENNFRRTSTSSAVIITNCYEWLMCWLLHSTTEQLQHADKDGTDRFKARNDSQVYRARDLSRAYSEYYALECFRKRCLREDIAENLKPVLSNVYLIYGMWCIDRHLATFYAGGFAVGPRFADAIRSALLGACGQLKDSAVAVADAIAPPDWVLNSVIAKSDGRLYENIQNVMMTNPGAMERASWWKDIVPSKMKAKL
ncbi:acyl-CoA oxidase [Culex quinquefasciatus]|uniref:acyl-CoA oxidase n=1 Tax=Culex quinquefasciatus TaxID=7176 RepID=B0W9X3_CULQU|nr:acyl-CoA oxidase [Culex quinquefasciatus]|eukprot:XP_001845507.1 acyl-CoA oxidase [Culex quinquefasciatus]